MDFIEIEFRHLKKAYRDEEPFRNAIDACTYQKPLSFQDLDKFCDGLASTLPGTSSVESDFSILKWEKDIYCMSLTDFSL